MSIPFEGPNQVTAYRAIVIAGAIDLYAKTGMKANRDHTPTNMLHIAGQLTGQKFKRGEFVRASTALRNMVKAIKLVEMVVNGVHTKPDGHPDISVPTTDLIDLLISTGDLPEAFRESARLEPQSCIDHGFVDIFHSGGVTRVYPNGQIDQFPN